VLRSAVVQELVHAGSVPAPRGRGDCVTTSPIGRRPTVQAPAEAGRAKPSPSVRTLSMLVQRHRAGSSSWNARGFAVVRRSSSGMAPLPHAERRRAVAVAVAGASPAQPCDCFARCMYRGLISGAADSSKRHRLLRSGDRSKMVGGPSGGEPHDLLGLDFDFGVKVKNTKGPTHAESFVSHRR
jgi:hypothetical protein